MKSRVLGRTFSSLIFAFLYAPIVFLIVFSFNDSKSRTHWAGFTTKWYQALFQDDLIINSLNTTLFVAVVSAVVATVIGTLSAIGINSMKKRPRSALMTINNIPVTNPDIITGVSLMLLFVSAGSFFGLRLGLATLILAHITFNIPYVILSVMPKLRQLSRHTFEAALDLGATPLQAYMRVIVPEIMPGIISGFIMAFTMSIDDFVISYFTAGSNVQTLPMTIYSMTRKRISPEINALSTLMFVTVLLLLVFINVYQARGAKARDDELYRYEEVDSK